MPDSRVPVVITLDEFLMPHPEHEGEQVVWRDGTLHALPEDDSDAVTVMRLVSCQ